MWWSTSSGRKRSRSHVGLSIDSDESEGSDPEDAVVVSAAQPINWSLTDSSDEDSYQRRRSHSEPSLDSSSLDFPVETTTRDTMHRRRTRTFPIDSNRLLDDNNDDNVMMTRNKTRWCTSFRLLAGLFLLCACTIFVPSTPNVPPLPTFEDNNRTQQQQTLLRIRSNNHGPAFARGDATHSLAFRHNELEHYYQQLQQQEENEWTWYLHLLVLLIVFVWFVKEKRQRGQTVCDF